MLNLPNPRKVKENKQGKRYTYRVRHKSTNSLRSFPRTPLFLRPNQISNTLRSPCDDNTMISDADLYSIAIVLGCVSALLIVLYHFIEVNGNTANSANGDALKGQSGKSQRAKQ